MKYVKKAEVIDAFQMTKERMLSKEDWPDWMIWAWGLNWGIVGSVYKSIFNNPNGYLKVHTRVGTRTVVPGDWIIKDGKGDLYTLIPEEFEATYEPEDVK